MSEIDKRNRLGGELFAYQITKNGTVAINYKGKQIKVVKGKEAERLIAKITGNFKRGNEKLSKNKRK
jgi:hypothetical protein